MRPWLRHFGQLIAVLAMLNLCGGQWVVLQSVAWGGMLLKYSQQESLLEAVAKTFDGNHPCNLCKGIQKADQQPVGERKLALEKKWDLKCSAYIRAQALYPPADFDLQPFVRQRALALAATPPAPPPRIALG